MLCGMGIRGRPLVAVHGVAANTARSVAVHNAKSAVVHQQRFYNSRLNITAPKYFERFVYSDGKTPGLPRNLAKQLRSREGQLSSTTQNQAFFGQQPTGGTRPGSKLEGPHAHRSKQNHGSSGTSSQSRKGPPPPPPPGAPQGNRGGPQGPGVPPPGSPNPPNMSQLLFPALLFGTMLLLSPSAGSGSSSREVSWQEFFTEMLANGEVQKLEVSAAKDAVYVYLHPGAIIKGQEVPVRPGTPSYQFTIGSVENFEAKMTAAQEELNIPLDQWIPITFQQENVFLSEVLSLLPMIVVLGISFVLLNRVRGGVGGGVGGLGSGSGGQQGGSPFSFGKANATVINAQSPSQHKVKLSDVAGMDEAKAEVLEFVQYLKTPEKFTSLGAKVPKGALLVGPPGTGKTLLAKAIAGEAQVPFYSMSGSDFVEMFVGVGPARVRDLFNQARGNSPCIIFIDEIDAIGRARNNSSMQGGNSERENTLNQLLVEMDGFNTSVGVVVLASTNRVDILDKALLRPGRFDRQVAIDLPNINERKDVFRVHLGPLELAVPVESLVDRMAALTPGFSGADIANVCNEAALHAARLGKEAIDRTDFDYACDRVIAGLEKKSRVLSTQEREIVANHEAGHAIVGWFLEHCDPVLKVSIIPRGNAALGFAQYLPTDQYLYSTEELMDRMCMTLGGRAAEEIIFGRITTGATDDLQKVTRMAYSQITYYGMNSNIGNISWPQSDPRDPHVKPYSDATAKRIDAEVMDLVDQAYDRTKNIIHEHLDGLKKLAEVLLEKEVLHYEDLVRILGEKRGHKEHPYESEIRNYGQELAPGGDTGGDGSPSSSNDETGPFQPAYVKKTHLKSSKSKQ
eukprot:Clim_evm67s22 gene=Clim_evmTU67s22